VRARRLAAVAVPLSLALSACALEAPAASADASGHADVARAADQASGGDSAQVGGALRIDLGLRDIDPQAGATAPVAFALPASARSAAVTATLETGDAYLAVEAWQHVGGPILIAPSWLATATAPLLCTEGCMFRQAARPRQQTALAPNTAEPFAVAGGHVVRIHAFAATPAGGWAPAGGTIRLRVDAALGPVPAKGVLAINLCLTGALGIRAAIAARHSRIAAAVADLRAIMAPAGLDVSIAFHDVTASPFVVHDRGDGEVSALFAAGAALPLAVNVFLVEKLTWQGGGKVKPIMGLSGGIPGPVREVGGPQAGVVVSLELKPGEDDRLGVAIAHEVGHYLGLFHTEEPPEGGAAPLLDPIADTPTGATDNLMYWSPAAHSRKLTADQATVLRASAWVAAPP